MQIVSGWSHYICNQKQRTGPGSGPKAQVSRCYLRKVPQPSKTVPSAGDQVLKHRGLFTFKWKPLASHTVLPPYALIHLTSHHRAHRVELSCLALLVSLDSSDPLQLLQTSDRILPDSCLGQPAVSPLNMPLSHSRQAWIPQHQSKWRVSS